VPAAVPESAARHLEEFTGRRWVLDRIDAWLGGTRRRLLLTGPPGAGKTLVAARVVQISDGDAPTDGRAHLRRGALDHALFCQARDPWTQNPLSFVEALSGRLAALHEGFRAALLGTGRREITISGEATAGTVAAGGRVIGVNVPVHVHDLAPVLAFDEAVRKPLAALGGQGIGRPVTVLVDALDETLQAGAGGLVELLGQALHPDAGLPPSLRFLLTARSNETRVLDALGPAGLDLVADAPADADDIGDHARRRLRVLAEPARSVLAARVAARSRGNFLYARHVLEDLRAHPERVDDPATFRLPADLDEVYREFLTRELAADRQARDWRTQHRPVLALLTAARGDGLELGTIAPAAGRLVGGRVWESQAADAVTACAQFLSGPLPHGPVRIYHQSFHQFLLTDPDLRTAQGEADQALAEHFLDEWAGDWARCEDGYALLHTPAHLARAARASPGRAERARLGRRLAALLADFGLLRAKLARFGVRALVEDQRLAAEIPGGVGEGLRPLQDALRLSAHVLDRDPDQLAGQLLGRLAGGPAGPEVGRLLEQADRWSARPWLRPATASLAAPGGALQRVLRHPGAGAVAVSADGRRAVSASADGIIQVWDLDGQQPPRTLRHAGPAAAGADPDELGQDATGPAGEGARGAAGPEAAAGLPAAEPAGLSALALTPDGRWAVSASSEGTLRVWDLEGRDPPRTLRGAGDTLRAVAVGADGRQAVCVCDGRAPLGPFWFSTVGVWDLETAGELRLVRFDGQMFRAAAVAADGRRVVFGSQSRSGQERLQVAELDRGREVVVPPGGGTPQRRLSDGLARTLREGRTVTAVAVTPDGRRAVSSCDGPELTAWDLAGGREPRVLAAGGAAGAPGSGFPAAGALAVTPDGRWALAGSFDGTLRVWDLDGPGAPRTLGHGAPVVAAALAHDGGRAVSAGADGTLKVWDLGGQADAAVPAPVGAASVTALAVTPDGRRAVSGAAGGRLALWDRDAGWAARTLRSTGPLVLDVAVTTDGRRAAAATADGRLTAWDLDRAGDAERLADWGAGVLSVAVTPDGRRAVVSSLRPAGGVRGAADAELRGPVLWDAGSDPEGRAMGDGDVELIRALTPDGRRALTTPTSSSDGAVKVWDLDRGGAPALLRHGDDVQAVALTSDGRRAVSSASARSGPAPAAWHGTFKVWDLDRGGDPLTLAHGDGVSRLAITPDGRWLVSDSADGSLKVRDLEQGVVVASFTADAAVGACAVAATGDGLLAVCGDASGAVHILLLSG